MEALVVALGASFVVRRDTPIELARGIVLFIAGITVGYMLFAK